MTTISSASPTVETAEDPPQEANPLMVIWCVLMGVLALASILGNLLVLGTLRHAWATVGAKPGNFLALTLAVADLLNTLVNLPVVLAGVVHGQWHGLHGFRMAHFFFLILLSGASNMLLCVISINRYAVVARPNTSEKVGRTRARNLALFAWCHALTAAVAGVATWAVVDGVMGQAADRSNDQVPPFASQIVSYGLVVLVPMVTMTVTYVRLFRRVKMRIRAVGAKRCVVPATVSQAAGQSVVQDGPSIFGAVKPHNMILARPSKKPRRHADLRTAVTLLILLGIFVLCWTPIMVVTLLVDLGRIQDPSFYLTLAAAVVFVIPACNPLVYSMRNANFRAAAADLLSAAWRRATAPCRGRRKAAGPSEQQPATVPVGNPAITA